MSFRVLIPARYQATRLPGKPLRVVAGRPLVEHVWRRACESGAEAVVVVTDDERVRATVAAFGGEALLTRADHATGTDRLAEAVSRLGYADETVVVNLQGDEPGTPGEVIRQLGEALAADSQTQMATACAPLEAAEIFDPHVVKVVTDAGGHALCFSRAPLPWDRERFPQDAPAALAAAPATWRRHLGLYAYRAGFLRRFAAWPACAIERIEQLEQLRALYHGVRVRVLDACAPVGPGVDTEADLAALRRRLEG